MYKKLSQTLQVAKSDGSQIALKKALRLFVKYISESLDTPLDYHTFADFIYDADNIFKTDTSEFKKNQADIRIISAGLLDEVLDMIGITDHTQIAASVRDAIFDLHARLSQGDPNTAPFIDALKDSLKILQLAAE